MESRCCLMHRLKKAVRASLVLLSLLFYVFGLHVHYVNRTVTAIGALKDSEPEVQQQALHYIMSGETNTRDGEYVLMKNGYHRGWKRFLLLDPYVIVYTAIYITIIFITIKMIKKSSQKKSYMLEDELCYLKEELEHFLFSSEITRKDQYEECNYILDRLEQRVYDVNELNETELNKMITFHQDIIHQINTPLNTIKLIIDFLSDQGAVDSESQKILNYSINKAAGLAHVYMRASKMDAGKVKFTYEKISVRDLTEEILTMLKTHAEFNQITLSNFCDDSFIYADSAWMKEAISNIVKNAIENAGMGNKVQISSCQEDEKVHIYIDDSGNPDEIIDESVFERYESSKAGIGIGLHLCKQIIESHLGDISVTRSPLLGGLRFTITLPIQNQKKKVELEDLQ